MLVTEVIQYSKYRSSLPTFLLFLDAKSAFDTVVGPYLVRKLFMTGMEGNSLLYTDIRLSSRITFCQFDKNVVGPIHDEHGVEQGGVSSSDFYKVYNKELLITAQKSNLGAELGGSQIISAVGQADDTVLVSNDINKLQHILRLVLEYCKKFNVQLSSTKTKLIMIPTVKAKQFIPFNPVCINNEEIPFVDQAEHVGVVRSITGNLPNIMKRLSSFKKVLSFLVACGLARGHRSNPAASLRILSIYATPVLLSGLHTLVLYSAETLRVDQQYRRTVQNILGLSKNSPASVVYFTAGSLPLTAILHLRQLSLFSMISRLPSDPLYSHAQHVLLTASSSSKSWFVVIRHLFLQYGLPHPLDILSNPPSKEAFKKLVKSKIIDFWGRKLRLTALPLINRSLRYFDTKFMSLSCPHPLLIAAGKNVDEVSKARIQLKLLVSQYPCGQLTRYWTPDNPDGLCSYPPCYSAGAVETREHLLLHCPAYVDVRLRMLSVCFKLSNPTSHHITVRLLLAGTTNEQMQLLLDSSSIPDVISAVQGVGDSVLGDLMYLGRTWCFAIHRARSKRLGLWKKA